MISPSRVKVEATLSSVKAFQGEARLSSVQAVQDEARLSSVHAVQIYRVKTCCQGSRVMGVARLSRIQAVRGEVRLSRVQAVQSSVPITPHVMTKLLPLIFFVPFGPIFQIFFFIFFSTSGNFLTIRHQPNGKFF